jgi:hypothetical protein
MTLHNQMAPSDKALPMGIEELTEVLRRYEQAVEAAEGSVAEQMPSSNSSEAHDGPDTEALDDLRTITVAGLQLTVDPTVFDDFELLESLAEIQRGDILGLPKVFRAVAGDQAQELLDAVRDERGRVTATAATEVLVQIMRELAPKA